MGWMSGSFQSFEPISATFYMLNLFSSNVSGGQWNYHLPPAFHNDNAKMEKFLFFSQFFNVGFTNYAAWGRFCFVLHPAGTRYSIEKQQKTTSLAAFDGPCLGASRLITGTVAVSTGLRFFSQNQKNRSITIKMLKPYSRLLKAASREPRVASLIFQNNKSTYFQ